VTAIPTSRLLLLSPLIGDQKGNERIHDRLASQGIPSDRLEVVSRCTREVYLEVFSRIDIHLDTFPYNGCTTTCDGLWMGVPTITLAGKAFASRNGLALLTPVDLTDLIANTPEDYISIAARLANDLVCLARIRASLRDRMRASPLMDATCLARGMEAEFRTAWKEWCIRAG
jgi:protein O-GlcNAc transferase